MVHIPKYAYQLQKISPNRIEIDSSKVLSSILPKFSLDHSRIALNSTIKIDYSSCNYHLNSSIADINTVKTKLDFCCEIISSTHTCTSRVINLSMTDITLRV